MGIFFSSYNVWKHVSYPALINRQPGVITVSVAHGDGATPVATMQLLPPDKVFKRIIEFANSPEDLDSIPGRVSYQRL